VDRKTHHHLVSEALPIDQNNAWFMVFINSADTLCDLDSAAGVRNAYFRKTEIPFDHQHSL
jgi:hypothetical protein